MKRAVICCGMTYEDISEMLEKLPYEVDIFKLSSRLHNKPADLGAKVQEMVDSLSGKGYQEIILTYFLCGNGLLGLTARDTPVVFAKVQDCIEACMGNCEGYDLWRKNTIFHSRGWLNNDKDTSDQTRAMRKRYDDERMKELYSMMYANYKNSVYMKLEKEIAPENMKKAEAFSELTGLELKVMDGSLDLYEDLLAVEHSDKIKRLAPGEKVTLSIFMENL